MTPITTDSWPTQGQRPQDPELSPDDVKGWLHLGEGEALARYASKCPGPWLEIGSYCGKSAVWLGRAAKECGTVLFTVDHHRGSPEMEPGQACHDPDLIGPDGHDSLPFLRDTLRRFDLEDVVFPIVGDSERVAVALADVGFGFVFIDGGHDHGTVADDYAAVAYQHDPRLLAFHDATKGPPGDVADEAEADGWELVEQVESLRVLRR